MKIQYMNSLAHPHKLSKKCSIYKMESLLSPEQKQELNELRQKTTLERYLKWAEEAKEVAKAVDIDPKYEIFHRLKG